MNLWVPTIPQTSGLGTDSVPVLKNLILLVRTRTRTASQKKIRIRTDFGPWISKTVRTRTFSVPSSFFENNPYPFPYPYLTKQNFSTIRIRIPQPTCEHLPTVKFLNPLITKKSGIVR